MIIKCQKPRNNLKGRIAEDYYLNNEKILGKNIFRRLSLSCCTKGIIFEPLLVDLDKNYEQASIQTENAMHNPCYDFIGLYDKVTDHLVAHTLLQVCLAKDGKLVLQAEEISIDSKEELMGSNEEGSINFVYGIYREIIKFIEELSVTRDFDVERIDLISLAEDKEFWVVTKELGYDISDSDDLPGRKIRFSKYVKERVITRERSYTNQQNQE